MLEDLFGEDADRNIAAHKQYIADYEPDFVKIMSDGFFGYPGDGEAPLGAEHPWIAAQARIVREVVAAAGGVCCFYNVFAPATLLRVIMGDGQFLSELEQNPDKIKAKLDVIASDFATLARLAMENGADGIYFSVQNPASAISAETYRRVLTPGEKSILAAVGNGINLLHCCGYGDNKNDLSIWTDYEAAAVNWATAIEGLSLSKGRELFGGRCVLGGFDNREGGILMSGNEAAVRAEAKRLLAEAGTVGVILGADCTVPPEFSPERLRWVREAAGL
jgi:uroporphyrinogen decarboxylase